MMKDFRHMSFARSPERMDFVSRGYETLYDFPANETTSAGYDHAHQTKARLGIAVTNLHCHSRA